MRRLAAPLGLTVVLLLARIVAVPALSDPVAGTAPPSLHLTVPPLYLLLSPVFTLWDGISMLSMSRLKGFLLGMLVLYLTWRLARGFQLRRTVGSRKQAWLRELVVLLVSATLLVAFLFCGALWHRPMLSLAGMDRDQRVVDFHTHTSLSHDVRNTLMRGYDAEANRRWHARAGFDAVFITDHNVVSRESGVRGRAVSGTENGDSTVLCPGIEVSAWRAHTVLLGDTLPVDRRRYNGSLDELLDLLRTSDSAYGSPSVASLPEYRRNLWGRLDTLLAAGLDGFEIVNAAPKANELRRAERDSVIALARSHNRFVVGVSDSHGWGATSMVWNLVRWPAGEPARESCTTVLHQLRLGFPAVQVIERHRLRPDDWWPMWLTPMGVVWEIWRSMGWLLTFSWVAWIWGGFLLRTTGLSANIAPARDPSLRKVNAPQPNSRNRSGGPRPGSHE
jgi:hypothetical protein